MIATARATDGVIHLAYRHDLVFKGDLETAGRIDLRAIEAIGAALDGTGRPFVVPSGTLAVPPGGPATEEDALDPASHRAPAENAALALARRPQPGRREPAAPGLEEAEPGARLHAVDDEGVPFREMADVIGHQLHLPVSCSTGGPPVHG